MLGEASKMRVLLVNDFVEKVGGVEIYCYELKALLEKEGYDIKFIGGHYKKSRLRKFLSSLLSIKFYYAVKKEIDDYKPELVHIHSISANVSPLFLHAIKKHKLPIIMTLHGFSHYICPQAWMMYKMREACKFGFSVTCLKYRCHPRMNLLYRILFWTKVWLHRWMVKKYVNIFIAPCEILAEYVRKSLAVENVVVIPHFIESRNWEQQEHKLDNKSILYIGRLSKEKGIEYLIKAMPLILARYPDARLHIVGEGKKDELEKLTEQLGNSAKSNIILHGYIGHERLGKIYNEACVFVLPSFCMETFPLTLIEAMCYGIPVITTNIGGQAELVKDGFNGYLVDPGNPPQLAEKIINILNNPELREELSKNAYASVQIFNSEAHIALIRQLYEFALVGVQGKERA